MSWRTSSSTRAKATADPSLSSNFSALSASTTISVSRSACCWAFWYSAGPFWPLFLPTTGVDRLGRLVHLDLHSQHPVAPGFEVGQQLQHLLLAELLEPLLQLLDRFRKVADGLVFLLPAFSRSFFLRSSVAPCWCG
jgi:hypothetical protein